MSEELKPCPFCGGSATAEQYDGATGAQWCANCDDPDCVGGAMPLVRYAREIEAITAWNTRADTDRIEALIAAGDKLCGFAGHDDGCQIMTHGVWSDPIPCTCGYTEAWKAWSAALGDTQ